MEKVRRRYSQLRVSFRSSARRQINGSDNQATSKDANQNDRTKPQGQPLFFTRLSAEIRQMIYEFALGDQRFELDATITDPKGVLFFAEGVDPTTALAFPRTCRQAYIESINLIYSLNTFRFRFLPSFWIFHRRLDTRLWNQIRHIEFSVRAERMLYYFIKLQLDDEVERVSTTAIWDLLKAMENLRTLSITSTEPRHRPWLWTVADVQHEQHIFLRSLPEVPGLEWYKVWTGLQVKPEGLKGANWPFELFCDVNETWR